MATEAEGPLAGALALYSVGANPYRSERRSRNFPKALPWAGAMHGCGRTIRMYIPHTWYVASKAFVQDKAMLDFALRQPPPTAVDIIATAVQNLVLEYC